MRINTKDAPPGVTVPEDFSYNPTTDDAAPTDAPTIESVSDLIARKKAKPQRHLLKTLGEYAWFMPLNALDQREMQRLQIKKVKKIDEITGKEEDSWEFDPVGVALVKVALSWTNSKGERLRGNAAIEAVGQLDPAVIREATEIVDKITKWGDAEKNSDENRGGNGSSSSQ